jgi:hypothetical protein
MHPVLGLVVARPFLREVALIVAEKCLDLPLNAICAAPTSRFSGWSLGNEPRQTGAHA